MKRFFGIIMTVIFLCLVGTTFSACSGKVVLPSSSITFAMGLDHEGVITQELDFSFQKEKLKSLGINNSLIEECKQNLIASVNTIRNEFYLAHLLVYSQDPNPEYKIGEAVNVSQTFYNQEFDVVSFNIVYKNLATFNYYQNKKSEASETKPKLEFFSKTTSKGTFPFASELTLQDGSKTTVGERYLKIYRTSFNLTLPNVIVDKMETPSFVYDYVTPYSNIKSNAEAQLEANGLYHNVWIKDINNFKDAMIELTFTSVNTSLWYLSLLVGVIIIFVVAVVIAKIIKIKKG